MWLIWSIHLESMSQVFRTWRKI